MSNNLRISILFVSLVLLFVLIALFRNGKLPFKYVLVWLVPVFIMFLIVVVPNLLTSIMRFLGFQTLSNMVVGVLLVLLFFVCISLTIIISNQNHKIVLLIQELSLLESKINEQEK